MKKVIATAVIAMLPFAAQAAKYQEQAVTDGGTITGKVIFKGKDEAPTVYKITKDNDVCGTGNREIDYVRVNNGALLDTVVFLDKVKAGKPFPKELNEAEIDQKGCKFNPFLNVVRNGGSTAAVNSDSVLHNIHTYEIIGRAKKTVYNISQPGGNTVTKKVKLRRGDAMKVECDAHDFMHGFVFVAKNPYFAVVKEDGTFEIKDVPPGKYRIVAWHGTLRNQKGNVEVAANGTATVDFTFK